MAFKLAFYNSRSGNFKGYVDDEVYETEAEAEAALEEAEENFSTGADVMRALGEKPAKNITIDVTEI